MSEITEGVRQVIESILRLKGGCTPQDLVNAARDPDSPAHAAFEWNDSKAAEEFRNSQARRLLRTTFVTIKNEPERIVWTPMPRDESERKPGTPPGVYRVISELYKRPDEWNRAVDAIVKYLEGAKRSLQELYDYAEAHQEAEDRRPAVKEAFGLFENIYQIIGQMRSPGVQPQARM